MKLIEHLWQEALKTAIFAVFEPVGGDDPPEASDPAALSAVPSEALSRFLVDPC